MNRKATLAIFSATVSIASFAPAANATNTAAETHAYLESERTRTDGQVAPINLARNQAGAPATVIAQPTAMDAWFEFQRTRTDGSTKAAPDAGRPSGYATHPVADAFRGRWY